MHTLAHKHTCVCAEAFSAWNQENMPRNMHTLIHRCIQTYMQEHFLVPNHEIVSIAGASFAGFYYICYERSTAAIFGYYYHQVLFVCVCVCVCAYIWRWICYERHGSDIGYYYHRVLFVCVCMYVCMTANLLWEEHSSDVWILLSSGMHVYTLRSSDWVFMASLLTIAYTYKYARIHMSIHIYIHTHVCICIYAHKESTEMFQSLQLRHVPNHRSSYEF